MLSGGNFLVTRGLSVYEVAGEGGQSVTCASICVKPGTNYNPRAVCDRLKLLEITYIYTYKCNSLKVKYQIWQSIVDF